MVRDPLVLVYETLKKAIKDVHGEGFQVFDDFPTEDEFRKENKNAAHISFISGSVEKGLLREYVPHKMSKNEDGTYTVATETCRMDYIMQVSFFASKKGIAQRMSTEFTSYIEERNELPLFNDQWKETMSIFLLSPPPPPHGDVDLWQCDQTWKCSGKLLTQSNVNAIDLKKFKFKIKNVK